MHKFLYVSNAVRSLQNILYCGHDLVRLKVKGEETRQPRYQG